MQRTRSGGAGCGHFSGTGGAGRRMLATAASAIAGGACVVGGCWTHWRCLGRPPASWKLARAAFGGSLRPPHEDGCAPAARHLAFASGAALSGFALMESAFGHVGLNVVDGLHPLLPTIVGSGLLAGIGAQIARGSMLTHIMQCGFQSSGRRESAVSAITAGAAAVGTSLVGHLNPDLFFVDPSAARHSMDAAIMFDGSSMVAFTAAGLLFIALRQHGFTKSNVIPVLGAFSSGALVGLGCGLMGLTNAQNIAALTSLSSAADPSVLLGVATAVAGNVFIMPRIKRLPDDSSASVVVDSHAASVNQSIIGSTLFGIGMGLTGTVPIAALVSLSTGSTSVWVWTASMLAGTASVQLAKHLRYKRHSSTLLEESPAA